MSDVDAKDHKQLTAAELIAELESDPSFVAAQADRDARQIRRDARIREHEKPIIRDLRTAGVDVETVWDLVGASRRPSIADVLLRHSDRRYPSKVRATVVRALATHASEHDFDELLRLYMHEADTDVRDGLAAALAATSGPEHVGRLTELATNARNGPSRIFLLQRISTSAGGREALDRLRDDPDLSKEVAHILSRRPHRDGDTATAAAELQELGSISQELARIPDIIAAIAAALALDENCVAAVTNSAEGLREDESAIVDCMGGGGAVRIELFRDDPSSVDFYVFGRADLATTVEHVLAAAISEDK